MAQQMAGLGLPDAMAAALAARQKPEPPEDFGIWPENWPAFRVFLAMATQWRYAGMSGVPTGLDYAALPMVLRSLRLKPGADMLDRLRIMEAEALDVFQAEARRT